MYAVASLPIATEFAWGMLMWVLLPYLLIQGHFPHMNILEKLSSNLNIGGRVEKVEN